LIGTPVCPRERLVIISYTTGCPLLKKGLGHLLQLLLLSFIYSHFIYLHYQIPLKTRLLIFTVKPWSKPLVNTFCSSLDSTLLFIESTMIHPLYLWVITYPFYFVVVPRRTSNLSEVRFGDVAVLKQISVLHRNNSWKFSVYLLDLRFLVRMPQVISKLSLVIHFLIWATENPLKIWPLSAVLFWQISANICVCRFIAFFFSSFDHRTFGEVATVVYALYVVILSWNLKQ
jgi:hypothetical protein